MNDFHVGSGVIVYDPFRGEMKRRVNQWCVVEIDKEITRYYRWWLQYEKHIRLAPPSWDAHISVVRGDGGDKVATEFQHLWKKYHKQPLQFIYAHVSNYKVVRSKLSSSADNGEYYIVDVECPTIENIRKELGLRTGWKFHLTFGRTYEYEARVPKSSRK